MGQNNKNIDERPTLFRMLTDGKAFWSVISKMWILLTVPFVFWTFSLKSQKNNLIDRNNRLHDSLALVTKKLEQSQKTNIKAFNFINSSSFEINNIYQQINLMQQSINKYEDSELIKDLKAQIYQLQIKANSLNVQIGEMKRVINGPQKKGKGKSK